MATEMFIQRFNTGQPQKTDDNIVFYGLSNVKGVTALEIAYKSGYKK